MHFILIICITIGLSAFNGYTVAAAEQAKISEKPPTVWEAEEAKWMPFPDIFPPGGKMAVINGDPATGPADFYSQVPAGYKAPWHFHTPIERVFVDQGTMKFSMRDGKSATLSQGGFIRFPKRVPHEVVCMSESECLFYLVSSGPFDIHLVDKDWNVTQSWKAGE